jgi:hypothetical protein
MQPRSMRTQSKKRVHFFYSQWFLLGIFVCLVWVTSAYARAYYEEYKVREQIQLLQQEQDRLQAKKLQTLEVFKYVKSDKFLHDKAHAELSMGRPGEKVVVVEISSSSDTGQGEELMILSEQVSNPIKWWRIFFK